MALVRKVILASKPFRAEVSIGLAVATPGLGEWIRYKLDRRFDHILVPHARIHQHAVRRPSKWIRRNRTLLHPVAPVEQQRRFAADAPTDLRRLQASCRHPHAVHNPHPHPSLIKRVGLALKQKRARRRRMPR